MNPQVDLVKRFLQAYPSGVPGLIVDLVEYDDESYIGLRIYRQQFEELNDSNRQKVAEWLRVIIPALATKNIHCILDVEGYVPNWRKM